jgi:peptide chain release factor 1
LINLIFILVGLLGGSFEIIPIILKQSIIVFKVVGKGAKQAFSKESGGHQWQRIPPTEKKGRVQTSLITVAVLPEADKTSLKISEKDIRIDTTKGTGAGGQHKNKTETAVRATHIPTGICVFVDSRSQHQNKQDALEILMGRLQEINEKHKHQERDDYRRNPIGDGERGSKIRVIREKDAIVINNLNNKSISYKDYCRGNLEQLI